MVYKYNQIFLVLKESLYVRLKLQKVHGKNMTIELFRHRKLTSLPSFSIIHIFPRTSEEPLVCLCVSCMHFPERVQTLESNRFFT